MIARTIAARLAAGSLIAGVALTLVACGGPPEDARGDPVPGDPVAVASDSKISSDAKAAILRDGSTGCDYVSIDGYKANAILPRTRNGRPVCDGTPARGFEPVSAVKLGEIEIVRIRDIGTGCLFLWLDGYESGGLAAVQRGDGQDCGAEGGE